MTVLQHGPWGHAGVIGRTLRRLGARLQVRRLWEGDQAPRASEVEALLVLGGQMCVDEQDAYPFLTDEIRLLEQCVEVGTPVLGICLGAQLLTEATGGQVRHGDPEIGFVPVVRTDSGRDDPVFAEFRDGSPTFNAHRDQMTAGSEAVILATGERTPVHAFRVGRRAYGLQFHPEFDAAQVTAYAAAPQPNAYLRRNGCDPDLLVKEANARSPAHRRMGSALARRWWQRVVGPDFHNMTQTTADIV